MQPELFPFMLLYICLYLFVFINLSVCLHFHLELLQGNSTVPVQVCWVRNLVPEVRHDLRVPVVTEIIINVIKFVAFNIILLFWFELLCPKFRFTSWSWYEIEIRFSNVWCLPEQYEWIFHSITTENLDKKYLLDACAAVL